MENMVSFYHARVVSVIEAVQKNERIGEDVKAKDIVANTPPILGGRIGSGSQEYRLFATKSTVVLYG